MVSLTQVKLPRTILTKLEEYKKSDDTCIGWSIYAENQIHQIQIRFKKSYPSNDWKKNENSNNTQLDHL